MENQRSNKLELADILREFSSVYQSGHSLCWSQQKAYDAITRCRTSELGRHQNTCDQCGYTRISYNSCRNRHCPKCQYLKQLMWVDKLKSRLLPTRYFHVVFTIPEFLNRIFYINQRRCYDMLFKASAEAIRKVASNPAFLGVQSGGVSVLHTWGQSLSYHPHIHMLVPAGGLDPDGQEWRYSSKKFFVPVKALSKIFRASLYGFLKKALARNELQIPQKDFALYTQPQLLRNKAYRQLWHVHIKKTFKGAGQVVSYLGRYTHRVAISNSRLLSLSNGVIKFRWKDYRDHRWKVMALDALDFIRRFLQHVLPNGYYKIRYYGIFSSVHSKGVMMQCFALLHVRPDFPRYEGLPAQEVLHLATGIDIVRCPQCKIGNMISEPKVLQSDGG